MRNLPIAMALPLGVVLALCSSVVSYASANRCEVSFLNKVIHSASIRKGPQILFPSKEQEPFQIAPLSSEPLTKEEQKWILSVIKPALKKAEAIGLLEDSVSEIMIFKSDSASSATGLATDNRRTLTISEWALNQRDSTVLIHELGHLLSDKHSDSYLNSILGMGEAIADLSIYFLSGKTFISSDIRARIPMRSMVDRTDVLFDRSRSANTVAKQLTPEQAHELQLTRSDYLGGELFSRILLDLLKVPEFKNDFSFAAFVRNMGQFTRFTGNSLRNGPVSSSLVNDIIRTHSQNSQSDHLILAALADCYWGLAVLKDSYPQHLQSLESVVQKRDINLTILDKFTETVQTYTKSFERRDFLGELKALNLGPYTKFKDSELQTREQTQQVIQNFRDYLTGIGKAVEIELRWDSDHIALAVQPAHKKVTVTRAFAQLRNMTRDIFVWSLLHGAGRIHAQGKRDEYGGVIESYADYWASEQFNNYLKKTGQAIHNKEGIPERAIRAVYFMMNHWKYVGSIQRDFHPLAQHPGPLEVETIANLQQKWDFAIEGAMR